MINNFRLDEKTMYPMAKYIKKLLENNRINLWFPSMWHIAFGEGTEYCLLLSV